MKLDSAEIVLWYTVSRGHFWEFNVNGRIVGESVHPDQKVVRETAMWIANSLEIPLREPTSEEMSTRDWNDKQHAYDRKTYGLGPVEPRKKPDLMDLFHDVPPNDQ